MSKAKEAPRKTYGDEEAQEVVAEAKETVTTDARNSIEATADILHCIMSDMETSSRERMLRRLFDGLGKERRMALCEKLEIRYHSDPIVGVSSLLASMVPGTIKYAAMFLDPVCQETLVGYFGDNPALRKPAGSG